MKELQITRREHQYLFKHASDTEDSGSDSDHKKVNLCHSKSTSSNEQDEETK
jgi:hypothetical protein